MKDHDQVPEGDVDISKGRRGLAIEDKILFGVILAVFCMIGILFIMLAGWASGIVGLAASGIGIASAMKWGFAISFTTSAVFALIAGEGVVGELWAMLFGFFVMLVVFTTSIALVF